MGEQLGVHEGKDHLSGLMGERGGPLLAHVNDQVLPVPELHLRAQPDLRSHDVEGDVAALGEEGAPVSGPLLIDVVGAALAVVPVDEVQVPASSLVSLALSCAREGQQVVVVDLCDGSPAARLLGAQEPGIQDVSVHDTRLTVAVPGPDDVLPVGPLHRGSALAQRTSFTEEVAATSASANLLLTLATLDPSLGGDHLATWATDAVAVVTAGRSSWTKVHGVAELIRLSGTRLVSAVLVGADKTDETLGTMLTPETV